MQTLSIATGIECGYPKVRNGRRRDRMEDTRHHQHWREDLRLCEELSAAPKELRWFMEHGRKAGPHCVMGMDYYAADERVVCPDGKEEPLGVFVTRRNPVYE